MPQPHPHPQLSSLLLVDSIFGLLFMLRTFQTCFSFAVQSYNASKNYYKILQVEENANQERIKASFKSLAKRYHPDFNKGTEEQFKEVNDAYQVLSDQETKREYDAARKTSSNPYAQSNSNPYSQNPYAQQNPYQQGGYKPYQQGGYDPNQQGYYHSHKGPQGYSEYYSWQGNQHQNPGQYGGWAARDQWLYEVYRKQQEEFMKQYQQAQRERFERGKNRGGRSPLEDQYMRRFTEEMMAREELRRTKEELRAERQRQAREEQERLQRQYAQSKRKIKDVGKVIVQDVKSIGKAAWELWLHYKNKK